MSDINNKLLEMYLANGAVSKNISMAERECLISNGAADGTWYSYLAGLGYTGSVNDMMYKFLGDKGYTAQGLNERLMQAAIGGGLFGHPLASLFAEGDDGFIYDMIESRLYVNSDGPEGVSPVQATAPGDLVGWIEDMSGLGNHAYQSTTASKPVYSVDDGLVSIAIAAVNNVPDRVFITPLIYSPGYAFGWNQANFIYVQKGLAANTYHNEVYNDVSSTSLFMHDYYTGQQRLTSQISTTAYSNPAVYCMGAHPTTTEARIAVYDLSAGTLEVEAAGGSAPVGQRVSYWGSSAYSSQYREYAKMPFLFARSRKLSAAEEATVLAYVTEKYSAWNP